MIHRVSILFIAGIWVAASALAASAIPIDMTTGRPVVEIEVGDGTRLKMILDSGAGGTVINAEVAHNLGYPVSGEQMIGDPSGYHQHMAKVVALKNVQIGGTPLGDLEAAAVDLSKAFGHGSRPIDGVLSLQALKNHLVTLDLAAGNMYLAQGQLEKNRANIVPYSSDRMGIPQIQVLVGKVTVKAFVDTGNPGNLSLARGIAKHLDLAGPIEVVGEGRTVSSTFEVSAGRLDGEVKFAGHTIENPTLNFDRFHRGTEANIGSGLLGQFVLTLDQRNKLIRFAPRPSTNRSRVASANSIH